MREVGQGLAALVGSVDVYHDGGITLRQIPHHTVETEKFTTMPIETAHLHDALAILHVIGPPFDGLGLKTRPVRFSFEQLASAYGFGPGLQVRDIRDHRPRLAEQG